MRVEDFYNYLLGEDRNKALMARILVSTMAPDSGISVDISELRKLSTKNRLAVDAFLNWRRWNRSESAFLGEKLIALACLKDS